MIASISPFTEGTSPGSKLIQFIPELDGIRGIAILLVLWFHFGARPPGVPRILTAPFSLGWSGVDLFFVLSGFLITGILLNTLDAGNYFSSFYLRRVLRIFPIYVLAVLLYFHAALPLAHSFGFWQGWNRSLEPWYWIHLSNWKSAFGHDIPLLTHFWSLAIEEQFYLLWPPVVFLAGRERLLKVCSGIIAISFILRCIASFFGFSYDVLYRLTPLRLEPLAFGGAIAVIVRNREWRLAVQNRLNLATALSTILIGTVVAASLSLFGRNSGARIPLLQTVGYTGFALLYSCLVFAATTYSGSSHWAARHLRHPVLRAFGKYSYGIYVLHFPIAYYQNLYVLKICDGMQAHWQIILWMAAKVIGPAASFGIALFSWNAVEKHFIALKDRFAPHQRTLVAPAR